MKDDLEGINKDANLIAAAPDMLEALELFQLEIICRGHGPASQALLDKIDAAIAKAKGGALG